ncbi:MAG: hypothetical protein K2R93_06855 [Gemmatimonadaceae bacterium]|nr:hypothetical protein [Gemmatimonadaceae bacterium]
MSPSASAATSTATTAATNTPPSRADQLPRVALALRVAALLIAVAGVIDPAITRPRASAPVVALVHGHWSGDSAAVHTVRARLAAAGAQVVDAAGPRDAARVIVGTGAADLPTTAAPTFLFAPSAVAVTAVVVPARVSLTAQVPVPVTVAGRRSTTALLELLDNARVVARDSAVLAPDARVTRTLRWVPSSVGTHALTVRVSAAGAAPRLVSRAVLVDSTRWRVLAYDARPSWTATFVRRALERDDRFEVRSRVVTTRTPQTLVTRATPRAPASLSALDARSVDVIVVGAPEALPASELAALRRLVSAEGIPVVLLPDEAAPSLVQWLGTSPWRTTPRRDPVALRAPLVPGGSAALRALVIAAPPALPPGSDALLQLGEQPVVWRQPVGAGEAVVNGALDAWRFRDPSTSGFETFWREVVATQVARRVPRVASSPEALSLAPGERQRIDVTASVAPTATWQPDGGAAIPIGVIPTSLRDHWVLVTPDARGQGTLTISAAGDSLRLPWVIRPDAGTGTDLDPALATAWTNTLGGQVVATVDALVPAVLQAAQARPEPLPWHPMRFPWWMLPFALALGGEWWLRRRSGRA